MKNRLIGLCIVCACCLMAKADDLKLWYQQPAKVWTEALPLGNGRLRAMVYGIESPARLDKKERAILCIYPFYILHLPVKKKSWQIII